MAETADIETLEEIKRDATDLGKVVGGGAGDADVATRLTGLLIPTVARVVAEMVGTNPVHAPVEFAAGLTATDRFFTVIHDGFVYVARASAVPFTTTATFNAAQWNLLGAAAREPAFADIASIRVPTEVAAMRTTGYAAAGDRGDGLVRKAGGQPGHAGKTQSADGAWWEVVAKDGVIHPDRVGGSFETAQAVARALGATVQFPRDAVTRLRAPSVTTWTGSSASDPLPVNSMADVLYGYHAGNLYEKTSRSAPWSLVTAIPVNPVELIPTPDGQVVAVGTTTIRKSSGWGTGTVSWTTKVTNSGGTSTFNGFSIGHSSDGTHIIVGEYASGASGVGAGGRETGRYVWYSSDGGATFATIYDSQTRYGAVAAAETHIHGCAYDEYQGNGVLYVIEGHDDGSGAVGGIYFSTDAGATWTRLENGETDVDGSQGGMPTSIIPLPGGIVCASDGPQQGVWHIERNGTDPANSYIRWVWRPGHGAAGITSFGRAHSIDRRHGTVYIGFSVNSSSIFYAPVFIIVSDGRSAVDAWTGTASHVAPDVNTMANIAVTPWGTITSVSEGSAPIKVIGTIDERRGLDVRHLDRGQVLGGRVTSASRSLAVGSGSVAALNATAVGAFANADQASAIAIGAVSKALGVQAIAIGDQAEAGTGATAIGYLVKAGGNSVVISNNKDLAALTDVVAIGDDITVGFGATVTVGEGASNTNTSGTVVGRNASNTAVNGTAIGTAAVCEHTFSIALGRSSTTTKTNQVHIDARQITMKNLGTPSAPPAGEGQWFVRDNGAGKMQFCVQAPTGGALVLATEP